jgi:hypothetical protein
MRVKIFGDSPIVGTLKEQFIREGYVVGERWPLFNIELIKGYIEKEGGKLIDGKLMIYSSDGELERFVLRHLCGLTQEPLLMHRGESQFAIKISVPQRFEYEISHAILRAINDLAHVKINWLTRWLKK